MAVKPIAIVLLLGCGLIFMTASASAAERTKGAEKPAKFDPASPAVEKLLRAEVAAEVDRRTQLAEMLKQQPDSAGARWQAGFVRDGDAWRSFDAPPRAAKANERLEEYRLLRAEARQTSRGQMDLVKWCRREGMKDQERAHLWAAVALADEPDQPRLLQRLGYQQVGGKWLSREQLLDWKERNRRIAGAVRKWGPRLERIADRVDGSQRQHDAALASLAKLIVDPDAIPAIQYVVSGRNEACAAAAVDAFAEKASCEATVALAQVGAFSKWPSVRERATAALKVRRFEDFVPALIGLLATPATGTFATTGVGWFLDRPYFERDGGSVFFIMTTAFILARETDNQFEIAVLHTVDHRLSNLYKGFVARLDGPPTLDPDNSGLLQPVATDLLLTRNAVDFERSNFEEVYKSDQFVHSINERTEQLNLQVVGILAGVTGHDPSPDPATWWQWWSDFSDSQQAHAKPVVTVLEEQTEDRGVGTQGVPRLSCFAAGTAVWTESGMQAIESIQVGDRVLAKEVETGELAYKPVLQTTVRPPKELTTLRCGEETIVCTGGHRFWSSGSGWVKARDLEGQTLLHTVTGNTPVWSARKGSTAETYNLVVADFHTYFVGKTGVLCQDLLIPKATNNVVPGLVRK